MSARPNFVFILADDLGYADLGCYGGRGLQAGRVGGRPSCSPALDRMAREGLRFTQGYANSSVCSPTRFALMTGRWQHRLRGGADEPIRSNARGNPDLGLPPSHPTLPSLLRDAGYATALVGKWHLGYPPHFGPLKSGYQEFFGALSGGMDYFTHRDTAGIHDLYENETEVHRKGYLTDLISERAVEFIKRRRKEPFLLSVHYNAPHWPWETRADAAESKRIGKIYHFDGGSVATYLTMIRHMDEGIGRILAALESAEIDDNTLVVFTSDNGGERFSDTWPLVGKKMDLLEGGIRVPYIVRWPAKVKPGGVTAQQAITMDWVATLLEAAGAKADKNYPLDGKSLLPVLKMPSRVFKRDLFWKMLYRDQKAMRSGDWKYLSVEGDEFLFNLAKDARERANYAKREPQRLDALRGKYRAWEESLPKHPDATYSVVATRADLATPSS
ncbi:MAG TPA: sulfatase-like hydrolase/transferase [Burkholderiales bacterium]|nr:sulfatase-like hydrolase/transferase [Burkholderiales bacterium]